MTAVASSPSSRSARLGLRATPEQEAVLRLGQEWVGVDPTTVQTLLLGLSGDFLNSLERTIALCKQQPGTPAEPPPPLSAAARRELWEAFQKSQAG